jgi:hypothetical protein
MGSFDYYLSMLYLSKGHQVNTFIQLKQLKEELKRIDVAAPS